MITDKQSGYEWDDELFECRGWYAYAIRDEEGWKGLAWGEDGYARLLDIFDDATEDDIITIGWQF